eukprot:TRINITY_DN20315_c0_g1_i1.p1 TRINITY_DN20315_c0_g1~~TRINITY_DN20315_c0_g1_i1.p1  ORF type:complete len:441 (+),score=58.57 TRINITY_DN20315_c0_g1_i1:69-1325(+)
MSWTVYNLTVPLVQVISVLLEVVCLVCLVGFFKPRKPELDLKGAPFKTQCQTAENQKSPARCQMWNSLVEDLASRSISIEDLLRFWSRLGSEVMPHYQPLVSKTKDVVRMAVVPLSRSAHGGGDCFARTLNPNDRSLPSVMVTHNWSNVFLHLVAAVVADALGESTYGDIANEMIDNGIDQLLDKLGSASSTRVWICAFCVNQHRSICGGFGDPPCDGSKDSEAYSRWEDNRRDTVTGEVFQTCNCNLEKVFSGVSSEMNKFDDMMALLKQIKDDFRHLVAVDADFQLFSRAWCVAELVQAHYSGLQQSVQIISDAELDVYDLDSEAFYKLATLSVVNCEASRPEDKADILSKIEDVEEFDGQLQVAIFGDRGLLRKHFSGLGFLEVAARVARRCNQVALRSSSSMLTEGDSATATNV